MRLDSGNISHGRPGLAGGSLAPLRKWILSTFTSQQRGRLQRRRSFGSQDVDPYLIGLARRLATPPRRSANAFAGELGDGLLSITSG